MLVGQDKTFTDIFCDGGQLQRAFILIINLENNLQINR